MDKDGTERATLRPLQEGDLPYLLEIAIAAWEPIYASTRTMLGAELFEAVWPDWRADKSGQIEAACRAEHGARVLVAELDGRPVAFASFYLDPEKGIGTIGNNAVHPGQQGAGLGARMVEAALEQMRAAGLRCVKVTTGGDAAHAPARRMYEKASFTRGVPSVTYYQEL